MKSSNSIKTIIILIFCLLTYKGNAQVSIGADVGITFNTLKLENSNNAVSTNNGYGYIISIPVKYKLNKHFYIETNPGLLQKNYTIENQKRIIQKVNNSYFQLPVGIESSFDLAPKISVNGLIGIYGAYWLSSKINGFAPNVFDISEQSTGTEEQINLQKINTTYNIDSKYDNRYEFGWTGRIGINYTFTTRLCFAIKGNLYRSLTDQQKSISELQRQKYNQTFAITMGASYIL